MYDVSFGHRIGSLILEGYTVGDTLDGFAVSDEDGDGNSDIGVKMKNGDVVWFAFDPEMLSAWPDPPGGCFSYLRTDRAGKPDSGAEKPVPESGE
ncbi:hypothetical protein FACS1894191_2440 [Clostridia bacterium]|nr:hypothetical protein FACS1894191_2440 [Clostridia bacterium]